MIEITIKVSDEQQTLRVNHIVYQKIVCADREDPILKDLIDAAVKSFKGTPQDIRVTIKFEA